MRSVGEQVEARVLSELVNRGFAVSVPFGYEHRYDLVVNHPEHGLLRVQCKAGRVRNGVLRFSGRSSTSNRSYVDEADVFVVYCADNDKLYWLSTEGLGQEPYLRIDPPKNVCRNEFRWARDYEI